jgi:quercetin dioxygenase-like cupin family protein
VSDPDLAFAALEPDGDQRLQPLRRQLGVSTFGMNLIVLEPRQRGRIHAHERQEEVLALGGDGEHHGRDGRAWSGWQEGGEGRPPAEVLLPDDLPELDGL